MDLNGETGDLLHVMYLSMARAGLAAMELYDPKAKKWGKCPRSLMVHLSALCTTKNGRVVRQITSVILKGRTCWRLCCPFLIECHLTERSNNRPDPHAMPLLDLKMHARRRRRRR